MKRLIFIIMLIICSFSFASAAEKAPKGKFLLLISEQKLKGPQKAWWVNKTDFSLSESKLVEKLRAQGYEVLLPAQISPIIQKNQGFRVLNLGEEKATKLGKLAGGDYVVLGNAVISGSANVPNSKLRSCFASLTARLIRVKNAKAIAFLDATGNSCNLDVTGGGKEALANAAEDLSARIVEVLKKEQNN